MTIPTLADHLAGKVAIAPGPPPSRVHTLRDDEPIKKSEARRGDTGRHAGGPVSAPCPPQRAKRRPALFGVLDDGSVRLAAPECRGTLAPAEAIELLHFLDILARSGWITDAARRKGPK
jgi:hypothetical protein